MARRRNNNRRRPRQGQNNNNSPAQPNALGYREFTQTATFIYNIATDATGVLSNANVLVNSANFPALQRELTGVKSWKVRRLNARLIAAGGADAVGLWAICVVPTTFGAPAAGVQSFSAVGGRVGPVSRELRSAPYSEVSWFLSTDTAAHVWLGQTGIPKSTTVGILEVTIAGSVRG